MTRRRPLPPMPDPSDPANHPWWNAYDLLDTIRMRARDIAVEAAAARDRFHAGHDPNLDALAEHLRCCDWWGRPDVLAIVAHPATLLPPAEEPR